MTEETLKCVKGESCIHCGSTYCRFVDEVNELEQENKELKKANEISIEKVTVTAEAKRLQELEQENKVLKDNNNHLQVIIDDGRAENKRFREENEELKKQIESDKGLITIGGKQQYDMTMAYAKYKTALEEIREIVTSAFAKQRPYKEDFAEIETKINEVLNLS